MQSSRDILRAVRDYQRPIQDPKKVVKVAKTLVVDGVTLTYEMNTLIVRTVDKSAQDDLKDAGSIFEPGKNNIVS